MKTLLISGLLALAAVAAQAHSGLDTTEPEDGAVLTDAPRHIVLTFDEDIRLTRVRMTLDDTIEVELDLGDQTTFATRFLVPFENRGSGLYRVEWRGLSHDGHAMRNAFTFRVR